MAIPPLVLRIVADSRGVAAGVKQAETKLQGFKQAALGFGKVAGIALGVAAVVGIKKATDAAADLGEAINATRVTFKQSAGAVVAWSKTAARSAGLAEAEALQAASGFGAMLDSAGLAGDEAADMSIKLTQLAGDLGSLRNVDPTEMLDNIRSGLAGEAEPLRRYGVFLSEARVAQEAVTLGLAKMGDELTDTQKIQARYSIIMQETNEAHGDFARTAGESLPNQLRILRAQIVNFGAHLGKVFLPIVTAVFRWINDNAIPFLSKMGTVIRETILPPLARFWKAVQENLWPALKKLWNIVQPIVKIIGGAFVISLGLVADALVIVINAVERLVDGLERVVELLDIFNRKRDIGRDENGMVTSAPSGGGVNPFNPFGRQSGGPVAAMRSYIVGESGPELFVPRVPGTIVPNDKISTGVTVVVNGDVWDADRFAQKVEAAVNRAASRH